MVEHEHGIHTNEHKHIQAVNMDQEQGDVKWKGNNILTILNNTWHMD